MATPRDSEPVLFRGCYFAATGASTAEQAFSAGLLRGARGRLFAEHLATDWTAEAEADDRHYRRLAIGVGLGGGFLTLLAWVYIIVVTQNSWWWLGLLAVILVLDRRPRPTRPLVIDASIRRPIRLNRCLARRSGT